MDKNKSIGPSVKKKLTNSDVFQVLAKPRKVFRKVFLFSNLIFEMKNVTTYRHYGG